LVAAVIESPTNSMRRVAVVGAIWGAAKTPSVESESSVRLCCM